MISHGWPGPREAAAKRLEWQLEELCEALPELLQEHAVTLDVQETGVEMELVDLHISSEEVLSVL